MATLQAQTECSAAQAATATVLSSFAATTSSSAATSSSSSPSSSFSSSSSFSALQAEVWARERQVAAAHAAAATLLAEELRLK
eukprot:jgi/Mesen1/139/ME1129169C07617